MASELAERVLVQLEAESDSNDYVCVDLASWARVLQVTEEEVEAALHELYELEALVYMVRINKETGERVHVVMLMRA